MYAFLLILNIIPVPLLLEYVFVCLLIGVIFADSKNRNTRALMLIISVVTMLMFSTSDGLLLVLEAWNHEKLYYMDAIRNIHFIACLMMLKLAILYRHEISTFVFDKLNLKRPNYALLMSEALILRFLNIYMSIFFILSSVTAYVGYQYVHSLATNKADLIDAAHSLYVKFAMMNWIGMALAMIFVYLIIILTLNRSASELDART